jgi:hypothetical protein
MVLPCYHVERTFAALKHLSLLRTCKYVSSTQRESLSTTRTNTIQQRSAGANQKVVAPEAFSLYCRSSLRRPPQRQKETQMARKVQKPIVGAHYHYEEDHKMALVEVVAQWQDICPIDGPGSSQPGWVGWDLKVLASISGKGWQVGETFHFGWDTKCGSAYKLGTLYEVNDVGI